MHKTLKTFFGGKGLEFFLRNFFIIVQLRDCFEHWFPLF